MTDTNLKEIEKIIQDFFKKMSFEVEVEILPIQDKTIPIRLKTEEPKILIGQNGQTLSEIQHLLRAILNHQASEQFYIDLDINDYKKKKIAYLKETAKELADEVALTRREKILFPMSAYERRIIHLELAGRNDITTESVGEEPERRIVIKPCP